MSKYYNQRLLVGNCLDTLKQLADDSIDSVVTDPPYELGFMGKSWDSTGIAFNIAVWQECMRVLKPGGHLLAFSGSRTYHRMAVAIEDAGFEIRDQIMWLYGSGFPKSMAIDKAIEAKMVTGKSSPKGQRMAAMGSDYKESPLAGTPGYGTTGNFVNKETDSKPLTITTKEAKQWQGWGTALKPAHEPIVVARKPISMKTVAENVLTYGTGAINIDASRVGYTNETDNRVGTDFVSNGGDASNNSNDNQVPNKHYVQMYKATGRFPANLIISHNPDCQLTGTVTDNITLNGQGNDKLFHGNFNGGHNQEPKSATSEIYNCTEGCPFLEFPNAGKGNNGKPFNYSGTEYNNKDTSLFNGDKPEAPSNYNDTGTAARFFYCAKTSKSERNAGLDNLKPIKTFSLNAGGRETKTAEGDWDDVTKRWISKPKQNFHPTVKPLTLMRYLIKLVTPPNGTVLDPFLGSGSTAVAAVLDGFNWKGCEMTEDYLPIIKGRVEHAIAEVKKAKQKKESTPTLFEEDKDDLDTTHI